MNDFQERVKEMRERSRKAWIRLWIFMGILTVIMAFAIFGFIIWFNSKLDKILEIWK